MRHFPLLILTGAPGWFGSRMAEMFCSGMFGLTGTRLRLLVHPSAVETMRKELARMSNGMETEVIATDLMDLHACKEAMRDAKDALLIHSAGVIHPKKSTREFELNVTGTQNLLEAASETGVKKIIVLSSNSQSGCNPRADHRFTESSPSNPYLGYGRSKMRMEKMATRLAAERDLDLTILRPCWFYGPRQPERQTTFFRLIRSGKFPLPGGGMALRSLTFVDDLCDAAMRAADQDISRGKTYWIADAEAYRLCDIVETVRNVLHNDFGLSVAPRCPSVPTVLATGCELADRVTQALGLYLQPIHVFGELDKHIACSTELAKNELGLNPSRTLREGMQQSIAWCIQRGDSV